MVAITFSACIFYVNSLDRWSSNNYIYKGDKNPLHMRRNYTVEFACQFELVLFPFDRQVRKNTSNTFFCSCQR